MSFTCDPTRQLAQLLGYSESGHYDLSYTEENAYSMSITLTDEEAVALYYYLETDECPNWWETPLAPLQPPLRDYHRHESPISDRRTP